MKAWISATAAFVLIFDVATASAAPLPHFPVSTGYKTVRAKLIKLGWHPLARRTSPDCGISADMCPTYPELLVCYGVGEAPCLYAWQHGATMIEVRAVGENMQNQAFDSIKTCRSITTGSVCN